MRVRALIGLALLAVSVGGRAPSLPAEGPPPIPFNAKAGVAATVSVRIVGLRSFGNSVYISLWAEKDAADFTKEEKIFSGRIVAVRGAEATARFDGLPPGRYAAALFHDEDENGVMTYGFLGLPKEGIGFSRNPRIGVGPPSFKETAFEAVGAVEIEIQVRYLF